MNTVPPLRALLPAGLYDLLPPEAEREAALVDRAMATFRAHGYQRVKPPLVEFEESLLSGVGQAWSRQTFRLLDPESQQMMGVRADMTLQVARIASTRLAHEPRPLRLSYTGEVLRIGADALNHERQVRQIGCELIGSLESAADAEIVLLAARTLAELGVAGVSIDLNVPTLVPAIFASHNLDAEAKTRLTAALARRDSAIAAADATIGPLLAALLDVSGPAAQAIAKLNKLDLPAAAESGRRQLVEAVSRIQASDPHLTLTIDPVERQGFEYQTGLSFTIFARGARRELGRGGRYNIGGGSGEPAVGFSLFADAVMRAAPSDAAPRRVYVPADAGPALAATLRAAGWITIAGLNKVADPAADASRLGCDHIVPASGGEPQKIISGGEPQPLT